MNSHSLSLLFVLTVSFLPANGIDSPFNKICSNDTCSDMTIHCHPTRDCLIQCVDENSCKNTTIDCPINANCEIECNAVDSCIDMTIYCPSVSADDSTENCMIQGNEKLNGLTIYAINGWSQIDIDYMPINNNPGTLYCGSSFESECNIVIMNGEYTCSEADHPCNIPDIVTTNTGEIDEAEESGEDESETDGIALTLSLWEIIIGSIVFIIIIACCIFMALFVYKTCIDSEIEEEPLPINPTKSMERTQSAPTALEMQQQNHLTTNYNHNRPQREISVSHASSVQNIPSSVPSSKSNIHVPPIAMSTAISAPIGPGHHLRRKVPSRSVASPYQYSPNASPISSHRSHQHKRPRKPTFDVSASYDPNINNSYLASKRHQANFPHLAVTHSSPLQSPENGGRRGSASSVTGSQYQVNNNTLNVLATERSLRSNIPTIDERASDVNINDNSMLFDDDIKEELPSSPAEPHYQPTYSDSEELFVNNNGSLGITPNGTPNGTPEKASGPFHQNMVFRKKSTHL